MKHRILTIVLASVVLASVVPLAFPAAARAEMDDNGVYPMVFPVQGPHSFRDDFGACRGGADCPRLHEGVDIMAKKGVPVVAAAAGQVIWISTDQSNCCYLGIRHDDGWVTRYIHLNNDTQNPDGSYSDDGQGWGIAEGITHGTRVHAGQLIAWVGNSGNAEHTAPHLHFELRKPDGSHGHGTAVSPYPSLVHAQPFSQQMAPCPEDALCTTVAFQDAGGRFHLWESLAWGSPKRTFFYGNPGDVAFSGDWNCDGTETLGLYRRSDGYVYLRNSNTQGIADVSFYFGVPGDFPIAGDFNGNGCDTVSIYRPSEARFYIINKLGSNDGGLGVAEYSFLFGNPGDKPFVGDFDGDGVDTIGLHRERTGLVYFRNSNSTGVADSQFVYGNPGDKLVAGDWNGDGKDTVAVYRPSDGRFYARLTNTAGNAQVTMQVGSMAGVVPIEP